MLDIIYEFDRKQIYMLAVSVPSATHAVRGGN